MRERIIPAEKSVIIAADVRGNEFIPLVDQTSSVEGISAYKIGFKVGYSRLSLPVAIDYVHENTPQKVIFDHQKAGTDVPDTGKDFAETMEEAGADAAILFPFSGPVTQAEWTKALQHKGIGVIVGSEMTHPKIRRSEGGYVADDAFAEMFELAIELGVRDFVVPGNKPDKVKLYHDFFKERIDEEEGFDLMAPGFVDQGGDVTEAGKAAGKNWHAIVGRGITQAMRRAAELHVKQILEV